eukprot:8431685-Heterocapsa_arctica.AAC.1
MQPHSALQNFLYRRQWKLHRVSGINHDLFYTEDSQSSYSIRGFEILEWGDEVVSMPLTPHANM